MNRFFKFAALMAVMLFSVSTAFAQLSIGGGYAYAGYNEKIGYNNELEQISKDKIPMNGFYIGADYNIELCKFLGIAPGLEYEFLRGKPVSKADIHWSENYLSIPIDVNFGFNLTENLRLSVFVTPTFSLGVTSRINIAGESFDMYEFLEDKLKTDKAYTRGDVMLGFGVAVDLFQHLRIKASGDFGVVDRFAQSDLKLYRNKFQFGAAFVF